MKNIDRNEFLVLEYSFPPNFEHIKDMNVYNVFYIYILLVLLFLLKTF